LIAKEQAVTDNPLVKISTIIPAFNAERTICQTVNSALEQRYEGHEIIVVNDGSSDSTLEILQSYGKKIRIVSQENGGAASARNTGVTHSNGEYVAFLDADDLWLPEKLTVMLSALARHPAASLAFSEYGLIDQCGAEYEESSIGAVASMPELMEQRPFPLTSFNDFISPSTWIIPRAIFERCGGFCESFKGAGFEDSWMLLLLREMGEFVYVPKKLSLYRRVPHPFEGADKYAPGVSTFISFVKKRYGQRGNVLIRDVKMKQCRSLLSKSAHQMNSGDKSGATQSLLRIAKLWPAYFLRSEFRERLLLPQNLKRIKDLGLSLRSISKLNR
jgi:glycosyltransferase involved in cell wall biosynthesis